MINIIANIVGVAIVVGAIATVLDKRINALQSELHRNKREIDGVITDKIEEICRDLRGETYVIEFWGGDCYGGFKKSGDSIDVSHSEAVLMTRQEAERIKKMLGTGAIVNRSKTILRNLEDK